MTNHDQKPLDLKKCLLQSNQFELKPKRQIFAGATAAPSEIPKEAKVNEKTFVEAAQAMALRVIKEGGPDNRSRTAYAFELCTGRKPTLAELMKLQRFWEDQYNYFENHSSDAVKVAVPDLKEMPEDVNLHKVAAWAMVSRTILNLDETITKE